MIDPNLKDNSGIIIDVISSGVIDQEGTDVLRKAKVVISKKENLETTPKIVSENASEENSDMSENKNQPVDEEVE